MLARKDTLTQLHNLKPATITWAQQWDDLRALWAEGMPVEDIAARLNRTVSAVLTQAVRIGLERRAPSGRKPQRGKEPQTPRRPVLVHSNVVSISQVRGYHGTVVESPPQNQKKSRNCLMCKTDFNSHGSHNRICTRCKDGASYQSGHDNEYRVLSA
jgi:hypothetical protein